MDLRRFLRNLCLKHYFRLAFEICLITAIKCKKKNNNTSCGLYYKRVTIEIYVSSYSYAASHHLRSTIWSFTLEVAFTIVMFIVQATVVSSSICCLVLVVSTLCQKMNSVTYH